MKSILKRKRGTGCAGLIPGIRAVFLIFLFVRRILKTVKDHIVAVISVV